MKADSAKDMLFHNIYLAKKKISAGSFGTVYLGENIETHA